MESKTVSWLHACEMGANHTICLGQLTISFAVFLLYSCNVNETKGLRDLTGTT